MEESESIEKIQTASPKGHGTMKSTATNEEEEEGDEELKIIIYDSLH